MPEKYDAENEEYVLNLPFHLLESGMDAHFYKLLTEFQFMEYKASKLEIQSLINDYTLTSKEADKFRDTQKNNLETIQKTLRLSAHVLQERTSDLAEQLWGRLEPYNSDIELLLSTARKSPKKPWLRSIKPNLVQPNSLLIQTLGGNTSQIKSVKFTVDGKSIVSGSEEGKINILNLDTQKEVHIFTGHINSINTISVTANNKYFISGSEDTTLKIWNLENRSESLTLIGHQGPVLTVITTHDSKWAISGSSDKTIKIWDVEDGYCKFTLEGHSDAVKDLAITSDDKKLVSLSSNNSIKIWDLDKNQETSEIISLDGEDPLGALAITPDDKYIIYSQSDVGWDGGVASNIRVLRFPECEEVAALRTLGEINTITAFKDNQQIFAGSSYGYIYVWNFPDEEPLFLLKDHRQSINSLDINCDNGLLISGSDDCTIKIWQIEEGNQFKFYGHDDQVNSIAIISDRKLVISGSYDGVLKVWSLETGDELSKFDGGWEPVEHLIPIPNKNQVIYVSANSLPNNEEILEVRHQQTNNELFSLLSYGSLREPLAVAPNGRWLASMLDDEFGLQIYDIGEPSQEPIILTGHSAEISSVVFTADSRTIISGAWDQTIKVWDIQRGKSIHTFKGHTANVNALAIASDDKRIISASDDGNLIVWNLYLGTKEKIFRGHKDRVNTVVVTPSSSRVISGSDDKDLIVWDLESGDLISKLEGHTGPVNTMKLSKDDQKLVSLSYNHELIVWNLITLNKIAAFNGDGGLICYEIVPDGTTIVAGERLSGRIHFLQLERASSM